jgi:O-antigen ligase
LSRNISRATKDWKLSLFYFNVAFVIIGYGINTATDQAFLSPIKIIRTFLIGIGIWDLAMYWFRYKVKFPKKGLFFILLYLFILSASSSFNTTYSLGRTFTFIFPVLYIFLFLTYMIRNYDIPMLWKSVLGILNWTYIIPIIVFIFFDRTASTSSLYGQTTSFVSNHYGWSSALFLLTSFDLIANYNIKKWRKYLIYAIIPISFFLLIISGSRSSWVSVLIAFAILISRNQKIHKIIKLSIIIFSTALTTYFINDKSSAIHTRMEKTVLQLEHSNRTENARLEWAEQAFNFFEKNPHLYLTGLGLFNYEGLERKGGYHNSYLEVFFGGGIIIFALFAYLFLIVPIYNYIKYYSKYLLILPPLIIIPFFESNLTGGQFLFFPWFTITLLLLIPLKVKRTSIKNH